MEVSAATRFVFLTQDFFPDIGGITTWVYELARHLRAAGHPVLVVTKSFDGFDGRELTDLPTLRLNHVRWKQKKYARLKEAIGPLNDGSTVFLCANWKMAVPCMYLSSYRRLPYFVAVHGLDALEGRRKNRLLQQYTLWRASGVLPVSRYTAGLLTMPRLKRSGRVHVLANGVDTGRFQRRSRKAAVESKYGLCGDIRLLNIGRLIERKGFDTTIRALPLLSDLDIHFFIGGKGPYESVLRRLADETGVAQRVHFLGFVDDSDLVDVYNAADIFCMPSRELAYQVEGFGITYLEAAACGVPSIGGRQSGAEDAIVDGETGVLVDPESPDDTAHAIRRLALDQRLRYQLGEAALARVQRQFTWRVTVDRLLEIIRAS